MSRPAQRNRLNPTPQDPLYGILAQIGYAFDNFTGELWVIPSATRCQELIPLHHEEMSPCGLVTVLNSAVPYVCGVVGVIYRLEIQIFHWKTLPQKPPNVSWIHSTIQARWRERPPGQPALLLRSQDLERARGVHEKASRFVNGESDDSGKPPYSRIYQTIPTEVWKAILQTLAPTSL